MKRSLIPLLIAVSLCAQNLQVHYEFLPERQYVVSTLEQFTGDEAGLTYWFISTQYDHSENDDFRDNSAVGVYGEFYRFFSIDALKGMMPALQYNDGLGVVYLDGGLIAGFPYGRTLLAGIAYNIKIFGVDVLSSLWWRKKQGYCHSWQFTAAWGHSFAKGKLTFNGFFDLWGERPLDVSDHFVVLLTEPQLYYNLNAHISIGTKLQLSRNFEMTQQDKLLAAPTAALRWNF